MNFRQRAVFGGCNAWKEEVRWGVWGATLEADGEHVDKALFHLADVGGTMSVHRKDNDNALRKALLLDLHGHDRLETCPGIPLRWGYYSGS